MKPVKFNPNSNVKEILIIIAVILAFSGTIIFFFTRAIDKAKKEEKEKCDTFVESLMHDNNTAFDIIRDENRKKMDASKVIYQESEHRLDSLKTELKKPKKYVPTSDRSTIAVNRRIDSLLSRFSEISTD
jgi:phage-related tail protein